MTRRHTVFTTALLAAALGLTGCSEPDGAESGDEGLPARVVEVPGTGLSRIHLTRDAVTRVGLETTPVRAASGPAARLLIPLQAVLYDEDGETWTYISPAPLEYMRQPIAIERVDREVAVLTEGPAVGTPVVTVGAAELLGVEEGVSGE
jgi:hypothetical protein